jgi:TPP-dependent pyruvate/acetoin dehydrogenase alpha subunit
VLIDDGVIREDEEKKIWAVEEASVQEAVKFALGSPEPEALEAFTDVFSEQG